MNLDLLVEAELDQNDWTKLVEADGSSVRIPAAFRELLKSGSPDESHKAYWKLENHVVVQGNLFEVAVYIVPAICAALLDFDRPKWVRIQLLELLFQIVHGESHADEVAQGRRDLGDRCRHAAREGLWLFYRIFQEGELWSAAKEIIEIIDTNPARLRTLQTLNKRHGRVDIEQQLKVPPTKP